MPCGKCGSDFNWLNWKIKCGECEDKFCNKCLKRREGVLYCEKCLILLKRPPDRTKLMELRPKDLQDYLNKHNISTCGLVEKQELVDLFCDKHIPEKPPRRGVEKFTANFAGSVPNLRPINELWGNLESVISNENRSSRPEPQPPPPRPRAQQPPLVSPTNIQPTFTESPTFVALTPRPRGQQPPQVSATSTQPTFTQSSTYMAQTSRPRAQQPSSRPGDQQPPSRPRDQQPPWRPRDQQPSSRSHDQEPPWRPRDQQPPRVSPTSTRPTTSTRIPESHGNFVPPKDEEKLSGSPHSKYPNLEDFCCAEELQSLTSKELKILLTLNRVDFRGCVEKSELLERAQRLWEDNNQQKKDIPENLPIQDLCKLCMDAPLDCVLLECGHIATCTECGKKLAECPICRQYVVRVVRTFKA